MARRRDTGRRAKASRVTSLPHARLAVVEERKVREYLLNPMHPDNGGKAKFFMSMGFAVDAWKRLAESLCEMARNAPVVFRSESAHGQKFVLEGEIQTPSGRTAHIRAVWIIDRDADAPRLITAYPST